jgi:adhesin transport system outer membrane protein
MYLRFKRLISLFGSPFSHPCPAARAGAQRPNERGPLKISQHITASGLFFKRASLGALVLILSTSVSAQLQTPLTLKDAVQKAVLNNPEILARWHTLRAAEGERDASAGALLPRVDLLGGLGAERRTDASTRSRYDRTSSSLTITQLLYDGFAARNEIKRLDHARLVRLFEFFDNSESVALEAARAYYDVLRYRALVRLAEDNFVQHRSVLEQTELKVNARVARAVDLEQVSARMALAEANLLTESSNLHDTTVRFQRIVGQLPTQEMPAPAPLNRAIPADAAKAVGDAQQSNGALLASIENVRSVNAALAARRGVFQPRIDLRLRGDQGNNLSGIPGRSTTAVAEVVMSWNLFNGHTDRAKERQFAEQLNVAKDLRDKACRDISQTVLIAYNDVRKVNEQMVFFEKNRISMVNTRNAYRLQFGIGQRTLLDMLDSENELFQAKRAVANAEQDINIAYARTHAVIGTLLTALELSKIETGAVREQIQSNGLDDDVQPCPVEPVAVYVADKDALIIRAKDLLKQNAQRDARESEVQPLTPVAPVTPIAPVLAPTPQSSLPPDFVDYIALRRALQNWRAAWAQRNVEDYLASYVPNFLPDTGGDTKAWKERSRASLARSGDVSVDIADLSVTLTDAARPSMVFKQTYKSQGSRNVVTKTIQWVRVGDRWLSARESSETSDPGSQ